MKQEILDYVKHYNGGVTFVELVRSLGDQARGDLEFYSSRNEAIVYWGGVSMEFIEAVGALLDEGEIKLVPTAALTYLMDGGACDLPLAKGNYNYKRDHWLPMAVNLGLGGIVDIPHQATVRRKR